MTLPAPWTMRGRRGWMHRYSRVLIERLRRKRAAHGVALGRVHRGVTLLGASAGHREGLACDGTPRSSAPLGANDRYGQSCLQATGHGLDGGSKACRVEMWRSADRSEWIAPLMVVGHPPRPRAGRRPGHHRSSTRLARRGLDEPGSLRPSPPDHGRRTRVAAPDPSYDARIDTAAASSTSSCLTCRFSLFRRLRWTRKRWRKPVTGTGIRSRRYRHASMQSCPATSSWSTHGT